MVVSGPVNGKLTEEYSDRGPAGGYPRGDKVFGIGGGRVRPKGLPSLTRSSGSGPRLREERP